MLIEIVGYTAMGLLLAALVLKKHVFIGTGTNLIGGALAGVYSFLLGAYPLVILNIVWCVISAIQLAKEYRMVA